MKRIQLTSMVMLLVFNSASVCKSSESEPGKSTQVRTVCYDGTYSDSDDFDKVVSEETSFGFVMTAVKSYDVSLFKDIDLISETGVNDVEVDYQVKYFRSQGKVTMDVFEIRDGIQVSLLDPIEGLVTLNPDEKPDVIFGDLGETVFLSELLNEPVFDDVGWWNRLCEWVSGAAQKVKEVVVSGLRFMCHVAVEIIGRDGCASLLNMSKDSKGIYHAAFNCWQQIGGYNDLYDFVFSLGSQMRPTKNEFFDEDEDGLYDYILWGWKGDYWELGYGGEMGIYRRLGRSQLWYVDKDLAIDMTLRIDYQYSVGDWTTIVDWNPKEAEGYPSKQWWITGFNPEFSYKKLESSDLLRATYTVRFVTKGYTSDFDRKLRDNFIRMYVEDVNRWRYDQSTEIFSFSF